MNNQKQVKVPEIIVLRAFCETVAKNHFKGLLPYQINFLNDCLNYNRVIGIFGRQMGKTTVISLLAPYLALKTQNYKILIIAPTDRQAGELFGRLKAFAENSGLISPFIESSTQREIIFKNGSTIRAMPTGDFGHTIRGQTADLLVIEESSYVKTDIFDQVIVPMISSKGTRGKIIQIGTPFFKNHFYRDANDEKYKVHTYDYTHSPLISEDFIDEQRKNLTSMQFAMEYEAKFIESTDSYFPSFLIQQATEDYEMISPEVAYARI